MVLQRIRNALDRLSVKAILQRFDKRQLQAQIDTHKLFLLTRLHTDRTPGPCPVVASPLACPTCRPDLHARGAPC